MVWTWARGWDAVSISGGGGIFGPFMQSASTKHHEKLDSYWFEGVIPVQKAKQCWGLTCWTHVTPKLLDDLSPLLAVWCMWGQQLIGRNWPSMNCSTKGSYTLWSRKKRKTYVKSQQIFSIQFSWPIFLK